jgi:hypothetical protein
LRSDGDDWIGPERIEETTQEDTQWRVARTNQQTRRTNCGTARATAADKVGSIGPKQQSIQQITIQSGPKERNKSAALPKKVRLDPALVDLGNNMSEEPLGVNVASLSLLSVPD